ncbi:hypothetical protein BVRB_038930 [Beta vulgaris subsp. vulgaris]|uniref:Uncharacterized protein n=1 Tax=Beta vulgaris subsp. vulgaris TaxID=3555 RepID=A0A0J7YNJ5_BETVV|nr:hypothetical protein BVRB_038930 [Beta vulgaris subsp. vulgaris]
MIYFVRWAAVIRSSLAKSESNNFQKFDAIKYDLQKIESIVYDLAIRKLTTAAS